MNPHLSLPITFQPLNKDQVLENPLLKELPVIFKSKLFLNFSAVLARAIEVHRINLVTVDPDKILHSKVVATAINNLSHRVSTGFEEQSLIREEVRGLPSKMKELLTEHSEKERGRTLIMLQDVKDYSEEKEKLRQIEELEKKVDNNKSEIDQLQMDVDAIRWRRRVLLSVLQEDTTCSSFSTKTILNIQNPQYLQNLQSHLPSLSSSLTSSSSSPSSLLSSPSQPRQQPQQQKQKPWEDERIWLEADVEKRGYQLRTKNLTHRNIWNEVHGPIAY
jgi:chromosome segregation ATPase